MTPEEQHQAHTFRSLNVPETLLKVLDKQEITVPTPIQHQAIPALMEGKDIVGIAQTGTGKTFAFGLPMLTHLSKGPGRALVLVPTRELAYQIEDSLRSLAAAVGIRTAVFVGGASMHLQIKAIKTNPRILVATPGRLNDHLMQRTVTLREVSILVFDEADQMFDMGFKPQIEKIIAQVPKKRQTMLFSATMPKEILSLATHHMQLPLRIEVAPSGTTVAKIEQEIFIVQRPDKLRLLESLLKDYAGSVLVFSRTKHGAKKIAASVRAMGHTASEIHSNRSLAQRKEALQGFKDGKYRVLVATDIAGRGIHVTGIQLVINFDLPDDYEDYVHRIGRTGRAGEEGRAISFATPDQQNDIRGIERLIRTPIKRRSLPSELPPPRAPARGTEDIFDFGRPDRPHRSGGGYRGGRGGGNRGGSRGGGSRGGRGGYSRGRR